MFPFFNYTPREAVLRNKKRGFTLLEMTIVIAVTSIMVVGVVSLALTVQGIANRSQQISETIDDLSYVKQLVTSWVYYFDSKDDYNIVMRSAGGVEGSQELVAVNKNDNTVSFGFSVVDDSVLAQYDDGKDRFCKRGNISHLAFANVGEAQADLPVLYRVTVYYFTWDTRGNQGIDSISFVVATRLGHTGGTV